MRHLLLTAMLAAAAACAPQQPIPIIYENQGPTPASAGTPEQQAARRLNRAMNQETRQDRAQDTDPYAASMAGAPTPATDFEVGGGDPEQDVPQIGIPFQ